MRDEMTLINGGRIALDRERQARCRARRRAEITPVIVEISRQTKRQLLQLGYLNNDELSDKNAVSRAASRFIADAARDWCNHE